VVRGLEEGGYDDVDKVVLLMVDNLNPHQPVSLYEAFPLSWRDGSWRRCRRITRQARQ
jgi:hypothetical protein